MITVYDRYSNQVWTIKPHSLFLMGDSLLSIRKSNNQCVDLRDNKGKLINWWCLEYVLKNPNIFKPITMTLGQFKDKIEELEKAGLITDDFELQVEDNDFHDTSIINIEVNKKIIIFITE